MPVTVPKTIPGKLAWAALAFFGLFGLSFLLLATKVFGGFGPCGGTAAVMLCLLILYISLPIGSLFLLAAGIIWKFRDSKRSEQQTAAT